MDTIVLDGDGWRGRSRGWGVWTVKTTSAWTVWTGTRGLKRIQRGRRTQCTGKVKGTRRPFEEKNFLQKKNQGGDLSVTVGERQKQWETCVEWYPSPARNVTWTDECIDVVRSQTFDEFFILDTRTECTDDDCDMVRLDHQSFTKWLTCLLSYFWTHFVNDGTHLGRPWQLTIWWQLSKGTFKSGFSVGSTNLFTSRTNGSNPVTQ